MDREIACVHCETVAQLIRALIKKLTHVLDQVRVIAGEAAAVLERDADLLMERDASLFMWAV
jgi:glutamate racemase